MNRLPEGFVLLILILCTGCRAVHFRSSVPGSLSLNPQDWDILYSYNMPEHPSSSDDGAWKIELPGLTANLHYVEVPYTAGTTIPAQVSVTFRVDSFDPDYNGVIDPTCSDPATFHIMLERRGDDLTQDYYRWWAVSGGYIFGSEDNSTITMVVPLRYDQWSSMRGHFNADEFDATLHNLMAVGLTFGGTGGCWGHGMDLLSGKATFTLISFSIQ